MWCKGGMVRLKRAFVRGGSSDRGELMRRASAMALGSLEKAAVGCVLHVA